MQFNMSRLLVHQFFSTKTSKCKRPSLSASVAVRCWWTSSAATTDNNDDNVRRWVGSNVQFTTHSNWWNQQRNNESQNNYILLMHQLGTQQILRWHSSPTRHQHHADDQYTPYQRYQMARKEALNSNNKGPDMRNCTSIDELATLAHNNLNDMGHRDISAFWTLISKLLIAQQRNSQFSSEEDQQPQEEKAQQLQQLLRQINSVYMKTMDDMSKFAPRELAQTALAIARIINTLNNSDKDSEEGNDRITLHEIILRGILIGNNNTTRRKDIIFQSIARASMPRLWKFDPHCLCNLAYAYAIVTPDNNNNNNSQPPNDVKVEDDGTIIIETSIPTLLKDDEDDDTTIKTILFHHIAKKSIQKLKQFNSQDVSNMVWSFAKAGVSHPRLFQQVGHLDNLRGFTSQGLSNTVWAYARTSISHPTLFERVASEVIIRQPDFNSQEVANLLWAFACTGQLDIDLFTCLESKVIRLLDQCNAQEIANIAWSYAVANVAAPSLFNNDFIHACVKKEDEFTNENLSQLHQWQLWQRELDKSDAVTLPSSLQEKCYNAFVSAKPTASRLQEDVTFVLASLGLEPQSEVLTKSGYRLDALVQVDKSKKLIYIEVDGPFHFLIDGSSETRTCPAGSTILKHRQVRSLDEEEEDGTYTSALVSIPYWHWYAMNDIGKKQQYLCSLLGLSFDIK